MRKCPFCAEEIQDEAIKCRHCGEFLFGAGLPSTSEKVILWYFRNTFLFLAFCCVGPLALPLIWFNPRFNAVVKILSTVIILALTYYLWLWCQASLKEVMGLFKDLE